MPDVPAPLDAFIEAVNSQDEQAFLGAFTSDGFVDGGQVASMTVREG